MAKLSKRQKISRIDLRYRRSVGEEESKEESVRELELVPPGEEEESIIAVIDEPLLVREKRGRQVMGNKHLMFHRRQAESSQPVVTIVVDVVATVDLNGNVVGTQTMAPTDAVPSGQAVPTVPAVPPFPSDLTVPAVPAMPSVNMPSVPSFPFPSGVPSIQTQAVTSEPILTVAPSGSPLATLAFTSNFNSTSSGTLISASTSTSTNSSSSSISLTSTSSSSSSSIISSSSSISSSTITSSSSISSSTLSESSWSDSIVPTATNYVVGGGPANTAAPPAAASTEANNSNPGNATTPLSTPKVVGSVIGSLAGATVLLVLVLILLRRYKRKQSGALELPGQDAGDSQPIAASGQDMAQRRSFPGGAAFLSRFSVASRSTAGTSTTGERGFQRISGRKLPSAFSEGMTSEQFEPREGTLSGSSFYRDDTGFYGGPGGPPGSSQTGQPGSSGVMGIKEKIMPSPARTPVIHHPDDAPPFGGAGSPFNRPQSPPAGMPQPRGTLGRSHPSFDGSRGSKFTEDV